MNEHEPKRRRRWYQFSLRTLMLFMLVCAVGFGWLGKKLDETRREQVVVAKIEKLGGDVSYHEMKGPDWLARHFRKVRRAGLGVYGPTQITDADLQHLKELTNLTGLWLKDTQITDAGLVHLKPLVKLEWLDLLGTQVTDAGLVHLKELTRLEELFLKRSQVTNAGLEHLKGLVNLKSLSLQGTHITDAGLVHLEGLTNLEGLDLIDTQVTNEGVEKLQQALPNCEIMH